MTPRSEAEFEKIRSESRKKITEAALDLFAKKGYSATTMEAIARKAGVAKGLIYNYFTTKEDLLYQSIIGGFADITPELAELETMDNPVETVVRFIDGMFSMFVDQIDMWRLQVGVFMNPEVPELIKKAVLEKNAEFTLFIEKLFSQCGVEDARSEAWIFAATLDGSMLYYLFWGEHFPLEECREILKKKYAALIKSSPGGGGAL